MNKTGRQPQANDADTPSRQASANNIFKNRKVFNDPIHGQVEIHPVCVRIIDTPQFQRLRHIKQLDACYLVYPGASHNRFEHSLGVCHLAGKLLKTIRERQPDEEITDCDILCVEIAGLCHDLGQGPFSHVFEKRFMPKMKKAFTHEGAARKMFEFMLERNSGKVKSDIQKIIAECKIPGFPEFEERDFTFIKEMIDDPKDIETGEWPYEGREEKKSFMYEIVANKRNGVDVDKWDYLARDSYMLGMKVNFDHNRCFASARVLKVNGMNGENGTNGAESAGDQHENIRSNRNGADDANRITVKRKQICYREKEAQDLYDMFYTRMTLHRRAYQHKTHKIIGMMICDALIAANDTFLIVGRKMSEIMEDMEAYTQLTDDVIQLILYSPNSEEQMGAGVEAQDTCRSGLAEARKILRDILNRRLYKCVSQTQIKKGKMNIEEFREQFIKILSAGENPVEENFIDFDVVNLDYGMEDRDPMEKVRFFKKDDIERPIKLTKNQVSYVLPDTFAEHIVRIYCKTTDTDTDKDYRSEKVKEAFEKWCKENKHPLPKGANSKTPSTGTLQTTGRTEPDSTPQTTGRTEPDSTPQTTERTEPDSTLHTTGRTEPDSTLQTTGRTETDSQRNSDEDLEHKHLAEPAHVTAGSTEDQQPQSYHGGGVDVRPEQPSSFDESMQ